MISKIIEFTYWLSGRLSRLFGKVHRRDGVHCRLSASVSEHTLLDAARSMGFESLIAYAKSSPLTPLKQLAEELGAQEWALHTGLLIEADRASNVEWFARSLFLRYLHQETSPDKYFGFIGPSWAVDLALYRTALALPKQFRAPVMRVALGYIRANVGFDWKPRSTEDSALRELFATYWSESSVVFYVPVVNMTSARHPRLPRLVVDGEDTPPHK